MHDARMKKTILALPALGLVMLVTACNGPQLYAAGQEYQRHHCEQLPDSGQRQACREDAGRSYDEYQRESGRQPR